MKMLALEFSSAQRSVAVLMDGFVRGRAMQPGGRSTHAFHLIERALVEAQLEREQIECLAIGLGPGSYTGIRAAIALAQGWQLARDIRILGLSSVECLAAEAQIQKCFGKINIVIDAQRKEFYLAGYEVSETVRREVERLRVASLGEVEAEMNAGAMVIGPEVSRWFPAGREIFPSATALGQLAVNRTEYVAGERLEPIYLRETQFVKASPPRVIPSITPP